MILSKVSQLARGRASFQTQFVKDSLLATMTCLLPSAGAAPAHHPVPKPACTAPPFGTWPLRIPLAPDSMHGTQFPY